MKDPLVRAAAALETRFLILASGRWDEPQLKQVRNAVRALAASTIWKVEDVLSTVEELAGAHWSHAEITAALSSSDAFRGATFLHRFGGGRDFLKAPTPSYTPPSPVIRAALEPIGKPDVADTENRKDRRPEVGTVPEPVADTLESPERRPRGSGEVQGVYDTLGRPLCRERSSDVRGSDGCSGGPLS